jgi:hypothetical protein
MTVSNVDFIWSHIFEECPGHVLTRNLPKISKPGHNNTTLLSHLLPKILLFCTKYPTKLVVNVSLD